MIRSVGRAQRRLFAVLLGLTLAACSGTRLDRPEGGPVAGPDSSTTAPTAPSSTSDAEMAVLAAYREFWATYDVYATEAAPFQPAVFHDRFEAVATDGEYEHLYRQFQLDRLRGWVSRGSEADVKRPKVVELTADRAVVDDCADDAGGVWDTHANTWIEPETPGAHSLFHVVLVRSDGRWRVTSVGGKDVTCDA